jgi:hypothetical protein
MPTGWRPEDVKDKFPLAKIEDVYHFKNIPLRLRVNWRLGLLSNSFSPLL